MTHQGDVKEVRAMKADCVVASRWLCLIQKAALEHNAKTTSNCKLAYAFCVCKEITVYQQVSIVYTSHSKRETKTRTADTQTVNKAALSYHFEYQYLEYWNAQVR